MPWVSCNLQPPRVPVEIEAPACTYTPCPVYRRRNKDKYKQEGAWKQIPLRMRNKFRGDWKYLVCSVYRNVLQSTNTSLCAIVQSRGPLSVFYPQLTLAAQRGNANFLQELSRHNHNSFQHTSYFIYHKLMTF